MEILFIFLIFLKLLISNRLIPKHNFYFVFWRSSIFFFSYLIIFSFLANLIWQEHNFNFDIANFLIPLLDFIYFLLFLLIFIFLINKYTREVSKQYFYFLMNLLFFFSFIYSFLNLYLLLEGKTLNVLEILFPLGNLIKYIWIIAPLFAAFHYQKLSKNQKKMFFLSLFLLLFLTVINGRRSLLLFIIYFLTFYCWRTYFAKKIIFILIFFSIYLFFSFYHLSFKHLTNKSLNLKERLDQIVNTARTGEVIRPSIRRIMHKYIIIEPVYDRLLQEEAVKLKPLKTAIYTPIPSAFLEYKPWPGSLDGNEFTSFEYLVNDFSFNRGWEMSEYMIPLEFIWYGDYFIFITYFIFSVLIMSILYRLSISFGDRLVILPLLTVYPGDYNYFQPGLIKLIQMISYNYFPGFVFLFLIMFFKSILSKKRA